MKILFLALLISSCFCYACTSDASCPTNWNCYNSECVTGDYKTGVSMITAGAVLLGIGQVLCIVDIILWCCLCAERDKQP